MRRRLAFCAWCSGWRRYWPITWGSKLYPVSHGICERCSVRVLDDYTQRKSGDPDGKKAQQNEQTASAT